MTNNLLLNTLKDIIRRKVWHIAEYFT